MTLNALDRKKKETEIMKMRYNISDAEVRIEERLQEIERIKDSIASFEGRIAELESELKQGLKELKK